MSLGLKQESGKLLDQVSEVKSLEAAFKKVKANKGSAGPDGGSLEEFEAELTEELIGFQLELRGKNYKP